MPELLELPELRRVLAELDMAELEQLATRILAARPPAGRRRFLDALELLRDDPQRPPVPFPGP